MHIFIGKLSAMARNSTSWKEGHNPKGTGSAKNTKTKIKEKSEYNMNYICQMYLQKCIPPHIPKFMAVV